MRRMQRPRLAALFLVLSAILLLQRNSHALTYKTSWLGNTFGGAGDKHVQNNASSIFVDTDGTVFTDSIWDEATHEASVYKNGDYLGFFNQLHGWGRIGGLAITANASYVYLGMGQSAVTGQTTGYPPAGTTWYCVRRYNKATRAPAPFTGGSGYDASMLIVSNSTRVKGLAVYNNELFVSDPTGSGTIRVYNATTMAPLRSFAVGNPGPLTFDSGGFLWVIQGATVNCYSTAGVYQSRQITGIVAPTALCGAPGGKLYVTDNGPNQNVRIYTNVTAGPTFSGTFGTTGGILAGTTTKGVADPLKFNGLTGVGVDGAGNIYVSHNGWGTDLKFDTGLGLELKSFTAAGALNWQLQGLEFVDGADVDPSANTQLWTKHEHMVMNYGQTAPGTEWQYKGFTLDRFTYPNDPRLHVGPHPASTHVRRLGGQLFLFVTDQQAGFLQVYRFKPATSGEIAIPCALFCRTTSSIEGGAWPPNQITGPWLWHDTNANGQFDAGEYQSHSGDNVGMYGWWADTQGNVWKAMRNTGIRKFAFTGLDASGVPSWSSYAASQFYARPAPFDGTMGDLRRIQYDPATDTMYLSGYNSAYPNSTNQWGPAGKILARYDNWGTSRTLHSGYPIVLPYSETDSTISTPKSFSVAGGYIFVANGANAKITVYNRDTGAVTGTITPGPEVGGTSGWMDIMECLRAYQLPTGEYIIYVEEDARAKIIMYRWTP